MPFQDREEAGSKLALRLKRYKNALILALPRGGVPVGAKIAKLLKIPLDIIITRKIGAPDNPELAIGAIAEGNIFYLDRLAILKLKVSKDKIEEIAKNEIIEMHRRKKEYRGNQPLPEIKDETIILVDDGIATGATIRAAILAIQKQKPAKLIVAVPVCSPEVFKDIKPLVDEIICLETPDSFNAVGAHYQSFPQITDAEVKSLLRLNQI